LIISIIVASLEDNGVTDDFRSRAGVRIADENRRRGMISKTQRVFCMSFFLNQMILLSIYKYFFIK
jgi:hypothetical protein